MDKIKKRVFIASVGFIITVALLVSVGFDHGTMSSVFTCPVNQTTDLFEWSVAGSTISLTPTDLANLDVLRECVRKKRTSPCDGLDCCINNVGFVCSAKEGTHFLYLFENNKRIKTTFDHSYCMVMGLEKWFPCNLM